MAASASVPGTPLATGASMVDLDEPSPPRPPVTRAESLKLVGGMAVVCAGLLVVLVVAVVAMIVVNGTSTDIVAIATSAFGMISTVVGAYFGLKIGADGTQTAVAGMRDEAAKAQAFAAHVPADVAETAINHAEKLSGTRGAKAVAGR
jgi:hypothetical protein